MSKSFQEIIAEVYFDEATSVYRWRGNNRIPSKDAIVQYGIDKLKCYLEAHTNQLREKESEAVISAYRKQFEETVNSNEVELLNPINGQKWNVQKIE